MLVETVATKCLVYSCRQHDLPTSVSGFWNNAWWFCAVKLITHRSNFL